jgi:hypothetical protein
MSRAYEQALDNEMSQQETFVRFGDLVNGDYIRFNENGTQEIFINGVSQGILVAGGGGGSGDVITEMSPPSFLTKSYPISFKVYRKGTRFFTDIDALLPSFKPTGKERFVRAVNGLDTNDGLTYETAYKSPDKAFDDVDAGNATIVTLDSEGSYFDFPSWSSASFGRVFSDEIYVRTYEKATEKARLFLGIKATWVKEGGYTNIYSDKTTGGYSDTDKLVSTIVEDEFGEPREYTLIPFDTDLATTLATVDATPGSCYRDTDNWYAHDFSSGVVTTDNAIPLKDDAKPFSIDSSVEDQVYYLESLVLVGGNSVVQCVNQIATDKTKTLFVAVDCEMYSNYTADTFFSRGFNTYNIRTKLGKCGQKDGFNYAEDGSSTYSGVYVEIDCISHDCSNVGTGTTNNCSTAHQECQGIRVNGSYYNSAGPTVADVHFTKNWIVGCFSENSAINQTIVCGNGTSGNTETQLDYVLGITPEEWITASDGTLTVNNTVTNFVKVDAPLIKYEK